MSDYGHELAFGVFLTPASQQREQAVQLARLAEAADLDLIDPLARYGFYGYGDEG